MNRLAIALCIFLAVVQHFPTVSAEHRASERVSSLLQSMLDQRDQPIVQQEHARAQNRLAHGMNMPAKAHRKEGRFSGPLREQVLNSLHLLRVTGAKASLDTEQRDNEFLNGNSGVGRIPKKYDYVQELKREFQNPKA